jgi:hypothetical protein
MTLLHTFILTKEERGLLLIVGLLLVFALIYWLERDRK